MNNWHFSIFDFGHSHFLTAIFRLGCSLIWSWNFPNESRETPPRRTSQKQNCQTPFLRRQRLSQSRRKLWEFRRKLVCGHFREVRNSSLICRELLRNCADTDVKFQGSCISRIQAKRMQSPATAADSRCPARALGQNWFEN